MSETSLDTIVSLSKRRGFIFPGSEIYGGLANSWDYGPLGAQLKKNIKDSWWKTFVEGREDMVGLDGSILMNPRVWQAVGHVDTFHDLMVEDTVTNKRYRADHLLEEAMGESVVGKSPEEIADLLDEYGVVSPDGNELSQPKEFNLMFRTTIGPVADDDNTVYLRPETAQAMFVNFKNVVQTSRKRVPFGLAQIGKAFRNEITPGNFTFRTLEFEQMEIEYFVEEADWEKSFEAWLASMQEWAQAIGLSADMVHTLEIDKKDLAHYSKRTVDIEFDFPFGRSELWGLAYRGDFDLKNHQEKSGENLEYTDPNDPSKKYLPHVVEPTFGVDRTLLALLISAYDEEEVEGENRVVLRFTPEIAPYQVAVLPLMRKPELEEVSKPLFDNLIADFRCEYDVTGSIGKRYRRQDEIGTPWCITVDYDSLEDNSVTIRDRDSMKQERVAIDKVSDWIAAAINS